MTAAVTPQAAPADDTRSIELTDGSVVSGRVISFENGVYTVASPSLGTLKLKDSEILSISSRSAPPRAMQSHPQSPAPKNTAESISRIESRIVADPEVMSLVMRLQQDPQVLEVLGDPTILRAIAARDLESLRDNPKIRELEGNPTIQKILMHLNQ